MCTPQCICEKLGGLGFEEAIRAWKYVRHYTENLQKLQVKLRDLDDCTETITREVSEATGRGDEIEVNVQHWQTDADSLKDDIEQLIGKSTTKASLSCVACSCPNIVWRYKFGKQTEEKRKDADALIGKYNNFNHQISHPKPRPPELESLSDKNYVNFDSRASIFKDIMDALKDSNVNMIGVFGLGGVGKTTLVKEVAEQMRKDGTFKQVAMAVVSKDLNVKEVQSKLADSLNFEFKAKADDQKRRADELWHKFTNGDKYLIILDDIWEEVKMKEIGIPCTNEKKGCKVVITSRNEDLLRFTMKVDGNFPIAGLPEGEGWNLFKKKVGNTIESRPEINSLARKVCRKCKGLPVAINALGAALEDKQEHAWTTALDKLDRYMLTKIEGIDQSVLASLRVSYDMLHSADAKSCFLLCCLFAEDAEIPIDELMRLCVARNLLDHNPDTLDKARNAVRTIVDTLKSASLLTTGGHETVVKIHDVIRDVGISISREEEAFLVEHGALRWPRNPTNEPLYKAMSLSFKNIKGLPDGLVYPRIHTLMVDNTKLYDLEVADNFFNGMTQLAVLTFTRMRMQRLPSSLAKLTNLKMLYLNKCQLTDIAVLKDLKSNLEVLSLRGSSIKELPPEIGQLTSLRVLDLQDCDELMVIPRGVISNLTGLEELYFPMTFDKWGATTDAQQDPSSSDNANFEELRESLANARLATLHIHVPNVNLLPKEDLKFADLKGFRISVGSKFDYSEALISRTCMLKLEGIQLRNEFIPLVEKAEVLVLKPESSVHPLRLFNKLTVLIIEHFKLKNLFSPTTARGLVHLEVLEVTSCEIMEGIVGFEGQKDENEITGHVKFSKLKRLKLKSLSNLISFFAKKEEMRTTMGSFSTRAQPLFNEQVIFPVLERLTIDGLGKIIKIWDKQLVAVWQEQGSFCQLTYVNIKKCKKLMHVFPSNMHPLLKNLEKLEVEECETMKGIAEFEGERDEDGVRNEVASLAREHLEMVGVTEIQDKQSLPEPREEVESLCRPVNNDDIIVFPRLPNLKSFCAKLGKAGTTEGNSTIHALPLFNGKVTFPVLKKLSIRRMNKIIEIWDKQSTAVLEEQGFFFQLTDLDVSECEKLMHVFHSKMHLPIKNLKVLRVSDCPTMEGIVEFEGEIDEDGLRNELCFSKLSSLELSGLANLESFCTKLEKAGTTEGNSIIHALPLFNRKVIFPVLEKLSIRKVHNIIEIWDKQSIAVFEEQGSFCQLTDLDVSGVEKLIHVFPSEMHSPLKNMKVLRVSDCPTMEGIVESKGEIDEDGVMNEVIFPVLEKLSIRKVHKIIEIWDKQSIAVFEEQGSFCQLTDLDVSEVEKLIHVFPSEMHSPLKNMKVLRVSDCPTMEGIVESKGEIDEDGLMNEIKLFTDTESFRIMGKAKLLSR
ncbi:hypothetical protein RHSIM_Rhsim03G0015100 [Rhododendron simsii]|uniref:AAA+ ATPase domain-containing protein n=1 Tax=Rhododendron simsii TaxID=118357 RepID=A0A834H8U4_RHOSS|nr:hypothetical protein RHSIM_Rhsim03G0015100 [Rhododendron simsii]